MATGKELKTIARKRLTTVRHLMAAEDWEAAVYMMALTLELTLKAASCKAQQTVKVMRLKILIMLTGALRIRV